MRRLLIFILCLSPASAWAGTCPGTWQSIDPNGSTVNISSYAGISSCFYASKALGSDSNDGTTEATGGGHGPWAHWPGSQGCTANCAAHTPVAGEGFILRGGDIWSGSELGTGWGWGGSSSSSQIYIGVDKNWFAGASWTRPIWNMSGGVGNTWLASPTAQWWWLDNIEVINMTNCINGVYVQGASNIRASQMYFHAWSHSCAGNNVGFFSQGGSGSMADHNVMDGSDSTRNTMNGAYSFWSQYQYNYTNYVVSSVLGNTDSVHDNVVHNAALSADGDHCNALFSFGALGNTQFMYNNWVDFGTLCAGGVNIWMNGNGSSPTPSVIGFAFGNVETNTSGGNLINIGAHGAGNYGTYYVFNNTVDCTNGGCGGTPPPGPFFAIYDQNNATIGGGALSFDTTPSGGSIIGPCNNGAGSSCHDQNPSVATVNAQGYNLSQIPPYSPISSCTVASCFSIQSGANLNSAVCSAILSAGGVGSADAYNACQLGSSGGVSYNTSNHTVSGPNYPTNMHPAIAAWDGGAYQAGASGPVTATPVISPATGTYTSTQTVSITDSTPSATIYYTTNGSTPTTSSPVYSSSFPVSATTTVQAIATAPGFSQSAVGQSILTITTPQTATPTVNFAGGTYNPSVSLTLSSATSGSTITYCVTTSSLTCTPTLTYSSPLLVSTNDTYISAFANAPGHIQSPTTTFGPYWIGTISLVSLQNFPQSAPTFNCSPVCPAQTIANVAAGNALLVMAQASGTASASAYISSISCSPSLGAFTLPAATQAWNASTLGVSLGYVISTSAASSPSCTVTMTGNSPTTALAFVQLHTSISGGFTISGVANSITTSACTSCQAPNVTVAGNNAVVSFGVPQGTFLSMNYPFGNAVIDTATLTIAGVHLNTSSGTGATAIQNNSHPATMGTIALSDGLPLTIAISGSGTGSVGGTNCSVGTVALAVNTPVNCTAIPSGGSSVTSSGTGSAIACSGANCAFTQTSASTLTYTFTAAAPTPTFAPGTGNYSSAQSVAISDTLAGSTICYTTDNSTPTANGAGVCTHGTTYSAPVSVSSSLTLKAIASKSGSADSAVGSAVYTINLLFPPSLSGNLGLSGNIGVIP